MSMESVVRDLRRENYRLLQRVNLLEKQLKAEKELNEKQRKRTFSEALEGTTVFTGGTGTMKWIWISVKDRLPDTSKFVLTYSADGFYGVEKYLVYLIFPCFLRTRYVQRHETIR